MNKSSDFLGTYFDRDSVLLIERWVRIIAWLTLFGYLFESGYTLYQNVLSAIISGFILDWYFILTILLRIVQGSVLFIILQALAKILLIFLDIEDNTRRAARNQNKER